MKGTKETGNFPYAAKALCYIEVRKDGSITQIPCNKDGAADAYKKAKNGETAIYAVWPREYKSELFCVDDLEAYADAYGISRGETHLHEIEYRLDSADDGKSRYAVVDLSFKCGCKLDLNNRKGIARDLKNQYGWEMTTSTGFGCRCGPTGEISYTVHVLRSSMKKP